MVREYIEVCRTAGVGPSGLISKCDRAITALRYVQLVTMSPRDAATLAEITHAVARIELWKTSLRKEKRLDAPRLVEEKEQDHDLSKLTSITRCTQIWVDYGNRRNCCHTAV